MRTTITKLFIAILLCLFISCNEDESTGPEGGTSSLTVPGQTLRGMIVTLNNGSKIYSINTETLLARGGAPLAGYTWSIASQSAFPAGTTVEPLTGILKHTGGTLTAGSHNFAMTVSDGSKTASGNFTLIIEQYDDFGPLAYFQQPLGVFNLNLPDAYTGTGYGASLHAFGDGALPWSWYLETGDLPPGMVIDQARGVIRGTPNSSAAGNSYTFTIKVMDHGGVAALNDPLNYHINVPR